MKVFKAYYKVLREDGKYSASDAFCHVQAFSKDDAEDQVLRALRDNVETVQKLGIVFTYIHEETYTWLPEIFRLQEEMAVIKSRLRGIALGSYSIRHHMEASVYIFICYVPWFAPLVVRGVGSNPIEAHNDLKSGVDGVLDSADLATLKHWECQYQDWCQSKQD